MLEDKIIWHVNERVSVVKKSVCITLDAEVIDGIRILAEESDRSFSQYVNVVLKRYLKNRTEHVKENKDTDKEE